MCGARRYVAVGCDLDLARLAFASPTAVEELCTARVGCDFSLEHRFPEVGAGGQGEGPFFFGKRDFWHAAANCDDFGARWKGVALFTKLIKKKAQKNGPPLSAARLLLDSVRSSLRSPCVHGSFTHATPEMLVRLCRALFLRRAAFRLRGIARLRAVAVSGGCRRCIYGRFLLLAATGLLFRLGCRVGIFIG